MSYVNATDTLVKGQAVVTAGMVLPSGDVRSPYPPGLLIGTIIDVSKDPNEVVQGALVQPAADLNGAEFVLVITKLSSGFSTPGPLASATPSSAGTAGASPKVSSPTGTAGASPKVSSADPGDNPRADSDPYALPLIGAGAGTPEPATLSPIVQMEPR